MDKQEIATLKSQFDELAHIDEESHIEFWGSSLFDMGRRKE